MGKKRVLTRVGTANFGWNDQGGERQGMIGRGHSLAGRPGGTRLYPAHPGNVKQWACPDLRQAADLLFADDLDARRAPRNLIITTPERDRRTFPAYAR